MTPDDEDDGNSPLSRAFGTEDNFGTQKATQEIFPPAVIPQDSEDYNIRYVDADYEYARRNVTNTIEKMEEVMDDMTKFARASQSARAYEVLATMFKTALDANKDLLELAKRNKDLKEQEAAAGDVVTNNTLVVTNDQLLKMLSDQGVQTKTRQVIEPKESPDAEE